jgi:hypothetical protein
MRAPVFSSCGNLLRDARNARPRQHSNVMSAPRTHDATDGGGTGHARVAFTNQPLCQPSYAGSMSDNVRLHGNGAQDDCGARHQPAPQPLASAVVGSLFAWCEISCSRSAGWNRPKSSIPWQRCQHLRKRVRTEWSHAHGAAGLTAAWQARAQTARAGMHARIEGSSLMCAAPR